METSFLIRHSHRFVRGELDDMDQEWKDKNEEEKERFRMYIKILQSFSCPICRDVSPERTIICLNGHCMCKECHAKTRPTVCCICRQSILDPVIPVRGMEDILREIIALVQGMIRFQTGERVDVCTISDQGTIVWKEGRILTVDYDRMSFFIQVGRHMMNRPFFSSKLAPLHTHTDIWRSMDNLPIGRKMEVMIDGQQWIPGIIIFRDLGESRIHIVFATNHTPEIQVQSFCIYSSLCIAVYPTFLEDIADWITIE